MTVTHTRPGECAAICKTQVKTQGLRAESDGRVCCHFTKHKPKLKGQGQRTKNKKPNTDNAVATLLQQKTNVAMPLQQLFSYATCCNSNVLQCVAIAMCF